MPRGIIIVGLGPGDPKRLTREAWGVLRRANEIYLRTRQHPVVPFLPKGPKLRSFDRLYERCDTFAEVYEAIAQKVLRLGRRPQGVVYAVPGDPSVGEESVRRIAVMARAEGISLRLVAGVSFFEPIFAALGIDPLAEGLQIIDATVLAARLYPPLDTDVPALVGQLYSRRLASDVKLTLLSLYPAEHRVTLVQRAGMTDQRVESIPLFELDRQDSIDLLTCLYLPPLAQASSLGSLGQVVARLRAPNGCPWDREQTHRSLRPFLLEETYEVLDALDADDPTVLCRELGDLLLQVFLHVQIAVEGGEFTMSDVAGELIAKLIRRHPHVFGEAAVADAAAVLKQWEAIKAEERNEVSEGQSMLADIPVGLPALARSQSIQRRVAQVGFDWPDVEGILDKVAEEAREAAQAEGAEARAREFGDLLFVLVNLARRLGIDAESALREANAQFRERFTKLERLCAERGLELKSMTLDEMNAMWEEVKGNEATSQQEMSQ